MRHLLTLLLLVGFSFAIGQSPSIETLLSAPFPTQLSGDPDGDRFAWVFNDEGRRNIWIGTPGQAPRQLTNYQLDDGQEITDMQFIPGQNALLFIRGGTPNRSGELPNPVSYTEPVSRSVYRLDIADQSIEKLVDGSSPAVNPTGTGFVYSSKGAIAYYDFAEKSSSTWVEARGGLGSWSWSPDGTRLAFVSSRGDHSFIGVVGEDATQVTWLSPSVDQDRYPAWSPDGSQIAFLRFPHESGGWPFQPQREGLPWSVVIHDLETSETRVRWTAPEGPGSVFRSVSADQQLYWTASDYLVFPWEGDGWTHLYGLPAKNGAPLRLTPGAFEVQFVSLTPDGRTLLYSSNQGDIDRQHVWRVTPGSGDPEQLTRGDGVEWSPVQNGGGTIGCLASTGTQPAAPKYLSNGDPRDLAPSALPDDWPANQLRAPEQVVFPAADGMEIHGQLFLPPGYSPDETYPALLFFHGGSRRQMLLGFHHRGYYHNAFAMNHYLAQQGYIVLAVNYRSGIGYGLNFREALNYGATGASEFNDVLGAGLFLRQRDDVDGDRIGLWGGSYGGYLTALGLARASDLFAAGVDLHGVHDWNKVIRNFRPSYREVEYPEFAKLAYTSSPMNDLDTWKSPVLMIHGDDDRNVPFSESVDLAESLRNRNVYFEQLVFPDEVHGFLLHRNWLAAYRATADFFDRMLIKD
jgi:dipeptidyl aminopeptidase/acylaminoacyl peptidase